MKIQDTRNKKQKIGFLTKWNHNVNFDNEKRNADR